LSIISPLRSPWIQWYFSWTWGSSL